jgi:hypothetical protein
MPNRRRYHREAEDLLGFAVVDRWTSPILRT